MALIKTTKIAFVVGANIARVNGNAISMKPSYIDNGRTMLPKICQRSAWNVGVMERKTKKYQFHSKAGKHHPLRRQIQQHDSYTIQSGDNMWTLA